MTWRNCPYCGRTCIGELSCYRQPCRDAARNDPHRNATAARLEAALEHPATLADELQQAVRRW